MVNTYIIGIDQTGAKKGGYCKPLPITVIDPTKKRVHTLNKNAKPLLLESCSWDRVKILLRDLNLTQPLPIYCAIDCCLGLPGEYQKGPNALESLKEYMCKTKLTKAWGASEAKLFFEKLQIPEASILRKNEESLSAHSLFAPFPFQKNVQTGTFRIWKDLALNEFKNVRFGDFEDDSESYNNVVLFEGYASYSARLLFQKQRTKVSTADINKLLKNFDDIPIDAIKNQDQLDSIILAVHMYLQTSGQKRTPKTRVIEGRILGLNT